MSHYINYSLSPIQKVGLNETIEVTVTIKDTNHLPVIGQEVNLKLVKPTTNKIRSIKANIPPKGHLNDILTNDLQRGCSWNPSRVFEKRLEHIETIIDFCWDKTGQIIALLAESLLVRKDLNIRGINGGKKVLINNNGDYIVASDDKIYHVLPALSNYIQTYTLKNFCKDFCSDENDIIWILQEGKYQRLERGTFKEFNLEGSFNNLYFYKGLGYFIGDQDCSVIKEESVINGFSLCSEKIKSFQGIRNYLVYTTESQKEVHILDLISKEKRIISLEFLNTAISLIKLDLDFNIYFSLGSTIFETILKEATPEIEIIIENEPVLEGFSITTSGKDELIVSAKNSKKEWIVWKARTSNDLQTYIIPIGNKVSSLKLTWASYDQRTLSSISDFLIQGSSNFGQIIEPLGLTDIQGQVKFSYIARKIEKSEKFIAIINENKSP
jgi:hypothetical protein